MPVSQWKERFLGIDELPGELTPFEMEEFFTLAPKDIEAICAGFNKQFRIAVAIQLGFVRLSGGRLNSFNTLPRPLLKFVGDQLGLEAPSIASIRGIYKRKNTRIQHQAWAMTYLGIQAITKRQEAMLLAAMRAASNGTSSVDRLIDLACRWLVDRKVLIPGLYAIRELCVRASSDTEQSTYVTICKATTPEQRQVWADALLASRKDGRSTLEWLQSAPRRRSPKNVASIFEKIDFLTSLGIHAVELPGVSSQRLQDYARLMQQRSPRSFKRLKLESQILQLVSFLKVSLSQASDAAIQLTGKMTSDIVSRAAQNVKKADATTVVSYREALTAIFGMANNEKLEATALREKILEFQQTFGDKVFPTRAAAVRSELVDQNKSIRPLLKRLANLDVKGNDDDKGLAGLGTLRDLYEKNRTALPDHVKGHSKLWEPLVGEQADRERAMRAFEAETLLNLRKGFRRGSCWVDYSNTFRDRDHLLIPAAEWEKQKRRHYGLLRLPHNVDDYLNPLIKAAEQGLKAVASALRRGELDIKENDISLDRLEAEGEAPEVAAVRLMIDQEIGSIQLPELMLEMDVLTRFSKALQGRLPRSDRELLLNYAGVLGLGTDVTASGVAMMVTELTSADVAGAMKGLEFDNAIDKANTLVLEFINQLPIIAMWGDGKSASSDMMSLTTSRHLWNARLDPRRQTPSVGMYTHVHDRWSIIYHQPIVLGERQAGVAIEGVIRQTQLDLNRLAVDTHGYTDVAMAVSHGLGFDLCPRLRNLRERRLTVPRGMAVPESIKEVVDSTLNLEHVRAHWDDLVRVLASISNGTISAVTALQRFGSAAQGDPIYRAAQQLGRLLRTIYLCDYFTNPIFRREITRLLNRGEHVHTLQHAIHLGAVRHDRGRRPDEMIAISGALTLLSNLVIAWQANRMQTAVTSLEAKGVSVSKEMLRHISPVRYSSVNFRGTFRFPIDRYRQSLIIDGAPSLKVIRSN